MPNKGTIRGTHHLTFCVGGAQEDYDFHVRLLGLKSVKKTVLFDGEIPIYHLYYGNRVGDASTLLTVVPLPPGRLDGQARHQPAARRSMLSVPGRRDRLLGRPLQRARASSTRSSRASARERVCFAHPCGIPYEIVGVAERRPRTPYEAHGVTAEHRASAAPTARRARCASPSCRPSSSPRAWAARRPARRASTTSSRSATTRATGASSSSSRSPTSRRARGHFGEGTIHHQAFDVGDADNQQVVKDWHRRPRLHRRLRVQGPRLLLLHVLRSPGGALCELAWSTEAGFTIDETVEELGTHMCIPPHWEDRRSEIAQLEPIETDEVVVSAPEPEPQRLRTGGPGAQAPGPPPLRYRIWTPEIARAMTSRWISEVPSKIV